MSDGLPSSVEAFRQLKEIRQNYRKTWYENKKFDVMTDELKDAIAKINENIKFGIDPSTFKSLSDHTSTYLCRRGYKVWYVSPNYAHGERGYYCVSPNTWTAWFISWFV